jgi:3-keto-5-aminohexanoate cleavage enzyme
MIISVALTGAVPRKEKFQALPTSPEEIIADALECGREGAAVVHIHTRDKEGRPVHSAEMMSEIISGIRAENSALVICATTTSRGASSTEERLRVLTLEPAALPDMVSLTLGSYNTPYGVNQNPIDDIEEICRRMASVGVKPEVEVFEPGMVATMWKLIDEGIMPDPAIVNFILGVQGASPASAYSLSQLVQLLNDKHEWAVGGIGYYQKPMGILGSLMGGNVRVGMEDDPRGENSRWSNAEAVKRARAVAEITGREVASPAEARLRLKLRQR